MYIFSSVIISVLILFPVFVSADPGKPERIYTLEKSINDGINNSNALLYTKQEITLNKSRVKEARSHLYPHFGINANVSKYTAQKMYALSPELGSTLLKPTGTTGDNYYSNRFILKKAIYTGGRVFSTLRLARASLERAKSQYQETTNNIIFDITRAFYTLLFCQEKERIFKKVLEDFNGFKGKKKKVSLLQRAGLQSLTAELESRIAEYTRDTERARLLFIKTMNIEHNTRISIKGELIPIEDQGISLIKCLAWANEYRPELKQHQFQEEIDVLSVNLSMAERYPTINFGASYEFNGSEFPLDSENWNATLSLNIPIFDGWAGWARVRQKRAQREQGRFKKAQLKDEISMEVRLAFSDYMFWQEQIEPRDKQLKVNRALISSMTRDLEKGKISQNEYLEILIKSAEIATRYLKAVREQYVAFKSIEKATGKALKN